MEDQNNKINRISERRKKIPMKTRLKVLFIAEHLTLKEAGEHEETTDEELLEAEKWAEKMTEYVMETYKKWETDGKPEYAKFIHCLNLT